MEKENDKQAVISLSDECFKHYLIQRYIEDPGYPNWRGLEEMSRELIPSDTWVALYQRAKADLENMGGRLTGYEMVDDVLVSHEGTISHWPLNWMWVMQFNNN